MFGCTFHLVHPARCVWCLDVSDTRLDTEVGLVLVITSFLKNVDALEGVTVPLAARGTHHGVQNLPEDYPVKGV